MNKDFIVRERCDTGVETCRNHVDRGRGAGGGGGSVKKIFCDDCSHFRKHRDPCTVY